MNGSAADSEGDLTYDFAAGTDAEVVITFDTVPVMIDRPHDLKTVTCGSLVFSVPVQYEKRMLEYTANGVERKFPYCDYEYIGTSDWNYGYADTGFEIIHNEVNEIPFSSEAPAVVLKAAVQKIPWDLADGFETVCDKMPLCTEPVGPVEEMLLYPYGCAKLRMTEIPLINK